jgi:hypothetical protein
VVGQITNGDESAYREEVKDLPVWCQEIISPSTSIRPKNSSWTIGKTSQAIDCPF